MIDLESWLGVQHESHTLGGCTFSSHLISLRIFQSHPSIFTKRVWKVSQIAIKFPSIFHASPACDELFLAKIYRGFLSPWT